MSSTTIPVAATPATPHVLIGGTAYAVPEIIEVMTHSLASNGEAYADDQYGTNLDVYVAEPGLFEDDRKALLDDLAAKAKARTESNITEYEAGVDEIAALIIEKFENEGDRNLAIGAATIRKARWQLHGFPEYTKKDFDDLCGKIRTRVRMSVAINAASIRVQTWAECSVLRDLIRADLGTSAGDLFSYHEYRELTTGKRALAFDKAKVEGVISNGWMTMIRDVVDRRTLDRKAVKPDTFDGLIAETEKRIAESKIKGSLDPVAAAAKLVNEENAKKVADANKATATISDAITAGVKSGHVTIAGAETILGKVAEAFATPIPSHAEVAALKADISSMFNPATCTLDDCDKLMRALASEGKVTEMHRIVAIGAKMLRKLDAGLASMAEPSTLPMPELKSPAPMTELKAVS